MPKVVVGMSGGVDSSVTAHLLKQQGFIVEGVSLILWEARKRTDFSTCCSLESMNSAAATCETLGIGHSAIDVRDDFIEKVIEPFVDAYTRGLTPNPCILCNKYIKFPVLFREAEKKGAEYVATGHYARVEGNHGQGGRDNICLKKGTDPAKDQSYVLYILRPDEIRRLTLPLGNYRKKEVREIARSLGLPAADRPESQEICFIEDRNYFKFIEKLSPLANEPGPIVDPRGKVLAMHKGIYRYTIGQRKGLGVCSPDPYYVIKIDTVKNTVWVGPREEARIRQVFIGRPNLILDPPSDSFRAAVKVRSMMEAKPAVVELFEDCARIVFDEPQWPPAPGQSAVFYDADRVIGGGVIERCIS